MILALDLGTTNWKAALIAPEGRATALAAIPTPMTEEDGHPCYDPIAMPGHLRSLLNQLPTLEVERIALTGMAEAGVMLRREGLQPLSMIWPWFDRRALPLFEKVKDSAPFAGREGVTGLPNGFKYGIYKYLTLLQSAPIAPEKTLWCGLVAYAAHLLTGEIAEDMTLAARTACLDIRAENRVWDADFLANLGLTAANFPRITAPGASVGVTKGTDFGLKAGIPVHIGGHDHVCAAHAVDALATGRCFLSTGTAQVMLRPADAIDASTGLSYGPCPDYGTGAAGMPYTCLGSIQSAGGSINYWRKLLFPGEDYAVLMQEAAAASPSRLIYFPYLAGRGAPHLDPHARGGLIGLTDDATRGEIIAAVYEGIACETRAVLHSMGHAPGEGIICLGGLTRHETYMQTLADVTGSPVHVPAVDEGTLYGAARLAEPSLPPLAIARTYVPDARRHAWWTRRWETRYLPMTHLMRTEESPWIE